MHIEDDQIHLWQLQQDDFELSVLERECLSWLSEDDLARYRRFRFDRHRKQLLLGRVLMRVALSRYDGTLAPEDWRFDHNDYGKPALGAGQDASRLRFNLSHSGERVVFAVTRGRELGVDIERAEKERRVLAIADRYFSASELAELQALPDESQQSRFYELWTLKEAYIKACGMGLAIELHHFSYSFPQPEGIAIAFDPRRADRADAWRLWQLDAGPDYWLALAARTAIAEQPLHLVSWDLKSFDRVVESDVKICRSG